MRVSGSFVNVSNSCISVNRCKKHVTFPPPKRHRESWAGLPAPPQPKRKQKPPKKCAGVFLSFTQKLWPWSLHRRSSRLCHCSLAVGKTDWSGGGSCASCSGHSLFFISVQFIAEGTIKVNSALFNIWRAAVSRQLANSLGFSKEFRNVFQELTSDLGRYRSSWCSLQKPKLWTRSVALQEQFF